MQEQTREFPKTFCVSPQYFLGDYIPISPGISHADAKADLPCTKFVLNYPVQGLVIELINILSSSSWSIISSLLPYKENIEQHLDF